MKGAELLIGLVGPVGTDIDSVVQCLERELKTVGYEPIPIRLSGLITDCHAFQHLKNMGDVPEDERIDNLMKAGDDLRSRMKRGDAVALLAVSRIRAIREENGNLPDQPLNKVAYILNSIKHPEEINTLRRIYSDSFITISIYAPESERVKKLSRKIALSKSKKPSKATNEKAIFLANKDKQEIHDQLGQNVRHAFPLADFFVAEKKDVGRQLERFIKLLFGYPFTTPTADEYGMYFAESAALRSADLSRQVGAVIATDDGEILSVGCNEVPKATGGALWEEKIDPEFDHRDFRRGYDSSTLLKREMIGEFLRAIADAKWLQEELSDLTADELTDRALYKDGDPEKKGGPVADTRAASVLEFGRMVHAEMAAITDAARLGVAVGRHTMYCTTFPCHMCARHIIAAGIRRVVYVEPYPKSLAKELYDRAIKVDDDVADSDAVAFEPFVGVSPEKYFQLFQMVKRKESRGRSVRWIAKNSEFRLQRISPNYPELEAIHVVFLKTGEVEFGLVAPE